MEKDEEGRGGGQAEGEEGEEEGEEKREEERNLEHISPSHTPPLDTPNLNRRILYLQEKKNWKMKKRD